MSSVWAFLSSNPWTTALVAAGILLAAGSLLYALLRRPGDEGLLRRDGLPLAWDRSFLPLDLYVFPDVGLEFEEALYAAHRVLREAVGRRFFVLQEWPFSSTLRRAPFGSVLIVLLPEDDPRDAVTEHEFDRGTGQILRATVRVSAKIDPERLPRVLLHEFGHVLGLDHDREEGSVMYPTALPGEFSLTARDKKLLRKTYG